MIVDGNAASDDITLCNIRVGKWNGCDKKKYVFGFSKKMFSAACGFPSSNFKLFKRIHVGQSRKVHTNTHLLSYWVTKIMLNFRNWRK